MKISDRYSVEINEIENDIDTLKAGQLYEIQDAPGYPSANTLGARLEKKFKELIRKIENDEPGILR